VTAFLFERAHGNEQVVNSNDLHRQLYCLLATLVLTGAVRPEQPLPCDPHLFGLGEHMPPP
jgi:hypothetical protein